MSYAIARELTFFVAQSKHSHKFSTLFLENIKSLYFPFSSCQHSYLQLSYPWDRGSKHIRIMWGNFQNIQLSLCSFVACYCIYLTLLRILYVLGTTVSSSFIKAIRWQCPCFLKLKFVSGICEQIAKRDLDRINADGAKYGQRNYLSFCTKSDQEREISV